MHHLALYSLVSALLGFPAVVGTWRGFARARRGGPKARRAQSRAGRQLQADRLVAAAHAGLVQPGGHGCRDVDRLGDAAAPAGVFARVPAARARARTDHARGVASLPRLHGISDPAAGDLRGRGTQGALRGGARRRTARVAQAKTARRCTARCTSGIRICSVFCWATSGAGRTWSAKRWATPTTSTDWRAGTPGACRLSGSTTGADSSWR